MTPSCSDTITVMSVTVTCTAVASELLSEVWRDLCPYNNWFACTMFF